MTSILFAKLDPGFFENRKVVRAGRNGRDVFLLAMCMNAARGAIGWIPAADLDADYVSYRLRLTEEEAQDGLRRAIAAGLLRRDGDAYMLVGWAQEWGRGSAKSDAERARAYRERKSAASGSATHAPVTPVTPVRDGTNHVFSPDSGPGSDTPSVTTVDHDQTVNEQGESGSRHESSRDSSRENHASRDQREKSRERRGARDTRKNPSLSVEGYALPDAWQPTKQIGALAQTIGVNLEHEAAQFRSWAKSKGIKSLDWNARFEGFIRGSRERGKHKSQAAQVEPARVRSFDSMGNPVEFTANPDGSTE